MTQWVSALFGAWVRERWCWRPWPVGVVADRVTHVTPSDKCVPAHHTLASKVCESVRMLLVPPCTICLVQGGVKGAGWHKRDTRNTLEVPEPPPPFSREGEHQKCWWPVTM